MGDGAVPLVSPSTGALDNGGNDAMVGGAAPTAVVPGAIPQEEVERLDVTVHVRGTYDRFSVSSSGLYNDVEWLHHAIGEEYHRLYGAIPSIRRLAASEDGQTLDGHERLRVVLARHRSVEAVVDHFEAGSLTQRLERLSGQAGRASGPNLWPGMTPVRRFPALATRVREGPLTSVNFEGALLGEDMVTALLRGLRHSPNLAHLTLDRNRLSTDHACLLAETVWSWPLLSLLSLGSTSLPSGGALAVITAGTPPGSTSPALGNLTVLDLSHNSLEDVGPSTIVQLLHRCSKLETLRLHGCTLSAALATSMQAATALETAPCLCHLSAGAASLRVRQGGGRLLAAAFALGQGMSPGPVLDAGSLDRQLRDLSVSNKRVPSAVASALASVIGTSGQQLSSVCLSHCGLAGQVALDLISGFRQLHALQDLALAGNDLDGPACALLATWLAGDCPVVDLDVSSCNLSGSSLDGILTAVGHRAGRSLLRKLSAAYNPVLTVSAAAVGHLRCLCLLDLRSTQLDGPAQAQAAHAWRLCHHQPDESLTIVTPDGVLLRAAPPSGRSAGDEATLPAPELTAAASTRHGVAETQTASVAAETKAAAAAEEEEDWF